MSKYLNVTTKLDDEAPTVEGRLADIIAVSEVVVDGYHLSDSDKARVVFALRRIVETGDRDPSIIASQ